jgi:hypothetical protein
VPNVLACLVHEPFDCAVDLVRNLNHLAPESLPIVYVDRRQFEPFAERWADQRLSAVLHPDPRPVPVRGTLARTWWFALDVMRLALRLCRFDAFTIVESDQLLVKRGFTRAVLAALEGHPRCGLLGSSLAGVRQGPSSPLAIARRAHAELPAWRPLLERFPRWDRSFVHYSFWPSLVLSGGVVAELVRWTDSDAGGEPDELLAASRITAAAELLLPTLVHLLGWDLLPSPANYRHCLWRQTLGEADVRAAVAEPDVFWLHPVRRDFDDPVRSLVRTLHSGYGERA